MCCSAVSHHTTPPAPDQSAWVESKLAICIGDVHYARVHSDSLLQASSTARAAIAWAMIKQAALDCIRTRHSREIAYSTQSKELHPGVQQTEYCVPAKHATQRPLLQHTQPWNTMQYMHVQGGVPAVLGGALRGITAPNTGCTGGPLGSGMFTTIAAARAAAACFACCNCCCCRSSCRW